MQNNALNETQVQLLEYKMRCEELESKLAQQER